VGKYRVKPLSFLLLFRLFFSVSREREDKKPKSTFLRVCLSVCVGFRVSDSIYLGYQKNEERQKKKDGSERLLNDAASLYYKTAFVFRSLFSAKRDTYTYCTEDELCLSKL